MENRRATARTHEEACARVASLFRSRWLRGYVGSKLRSDPVFPAVFDLLRESRAPLLDLGCGVGLLEFYLRERGWQNEAVGLDADAQKIRQAVETGNSRYRGVQFLEQDVRDPLPQFSGNVTALDLLHYLEPADQTALLVELAKRVAPGGWLLLRDSPRDGSLRHRLTHAGEVFAQTISWNLKTPLHFPTRASINAAFPESEFIRDERPAFGRTPFNNRLFIFRRKPGGTPAVAS